MTPKDKGMLRELLHEYGASELIRILAKESHGREAARYLRGLAGVLDPDTIILGTNWPSRGMITWADSAIRWASE